jgi:hypothetical protein
MSIYDYDDKRSRERARQDVDSLNQAVNLWLAIGLLDMAKTSRKNDCRRAASIRAHRAAGVMLGHFVQAEVDNAARQESREFELDRLDLHLAGMP